MPKFLDRPVWYNDNGQEVFGVGLNNSTSTAGGVVYKKTLSKECGVSKGNPGEFLVYQNSLPRFVKLIQYMPLLASIPTLLSKYLNSSLSWTSYSGAFLMLFSSNDITVNFGSDSSVQAPFLIVNITGYNVNGAIIKNGSVTTYERSISAITSVNITSASNGYGYIFSTDNP